MTSRWFHCHEEKKKNNSQDYPNHLISSCAWVQGFTCHMCCYQLRACHGFRSSVYQQKHKILREKKLRTTKLTLNYLSVSKTHDKKQEEISVQETANAAFPGLRWFYLDRRNLCDVKSTRVGCGHLDSLAKVGIEAKKKADFKPISEKG